MLSVLPTFSAVKYVTVLDEWADIRTIATLNKLGKMSGV
jgi:hypothetical protein